MRVPVPAHHVAIAGRVERNDECRDPVVDHLRRLLFFNSDYRLINLDFPPPDKDWVNETLGYEQRLHGDARLSHRSAIGAPFRPMLTGQQLRSSRPTRIGIGVTVAEESVVMAGVDLEDGVQVRRHVVIHTDSVLSEGVRVATLPRRQITEVGVGCSVGANSVVCMLLPDHSEVGSDSLVAGTSFHRINPLINWDSPGADREGPTFGNRTMLLGATYGSPRVGDGSIVDFGARLSCPPTPWWWEIINSYRWRIT